MKIGSLFSGIGGLELGLERAGLGPVVWQVERDEFCRGVLARHWPDARRFDDVCTVGTAQLAPVDLICGGFPCQDVSDASRGRGGGITGERSGLWRQFARLIGELLPRFVVVENVAGAAWRKWLPVVRCDLWSLGYSSLPILLRASDVGAPFAGARVFVAAAHGEGESARRLHAQVALLPELAAASRKDWGRPASDALGVADGLPAGVERLRALGNAVVPQQAEVIGHVIQRLSIGGTP